MPNADAMSSGYPGTGIDLRRQQVLLKANIQRSSGLRRPGVRIIRQPRVDKDGRSVLSLLEWPTAHTTSVRTVTERYPSCTPTDPAHVPLPLSLCLSTT